MANELYADWVSPRPDPRPSWDEYFLTIAAAVSRRADCTRRKVGAVIVGPDHRIIECGYNGSEPGKPGCLTDGACPRGRGETLITGDYDMCVAIHAEMNALLRAGVRAQGATLYCTDWPCRGCMKHIRAAGIARVITPVEETWFG